MDLEDKKVLVVGFGRTGEALSNFLLQHGAKVKLSEKKTREELGPAITNLEKKGVVIETGTHNAESFTEADLIVPSPGVPPWIPELDAAAKKGIQVLSEIELAYLFLKGKIVGITGTNGKSTTATLAHKILKEGGHQAFLAGNIGTPLISFVKDSLDNHVYVTEVSSFQLKFIEQLRAEVSVFLNVSPDHLDWHSSFDDYFESKKKLLCTQGDNDSTILNKDDPLIWGLREKGKPRVYAFSRKTEVERGCFLRGEWLILKDSGEEKLMKTSEIPLFGIHNLENVMASTLVGHTMGIPAARIRESIKGFHGLEHRLEKVTTFGEVDFYNDSKATNVDASIKSIQSFDKKIILILGGRDKGGDFKKLRGPVAEKVKKAILIGEARDRIRKALEGSVPLETVSTYREAVRLGYSEAKAGEVVLLAPACTSFDMFQNFEERGLVFKKEVYELKKDAEKERG
ncbi:MAG: UDP-N-acetylmuramoyl-L-alanine--D-glutamate ligase [Candidatus Aminicenantes bacterium]|nr:MAG: UDP-N-acetylmuramoyl-L-alanine--D-glutamate ligase [Candidatus Aminicenantes bacterium]